MGTVEELVGAVVSGGVALWTERGDICYRGPESAVDFNRMEELRGRKASVVHLLEARRVVGLTRLEPTSHEQRRMAWRAVHDTNAASYHLCIRIDLDGPLDQQRLGDAVRLLVARHEGLRCRYSDYGGHVLQEVHQPPPRVLQILGRQVLEGRGESEVAEWCAVRGRAPFDLAREAPVRWCLAPRGDQRALLLVTAHHIACDGHSIDRILQELRTLYCEGSAGLQNPLSTPGDFARWELGWLTPERVAIARQCMAQQLDGVALTPMLRRTGSVVRPGGDADAIERHIGPEIVQGAEELARSLRVSEYSVYFGAFALVLAEETVEQACAMVIAVRNRTRPEHEDMVGLARNAQPVGGRVDRAAGLAEAALRMSERVELLAACPWFPVGLLEVAGAAGEVLDPRVLPITFAQAAADDDTWTLGDVHGTVRDVFLGAARAGLSVFVRRRGRVAEAAFEYAIADVGREDVEAIADRYLHILTQGVLAALPEGR